MSGQNSPPKLPDSDAQQRAAAIEWLVLDVDGVLTDGGLIRGDDGQEYKRFHAHDGLGLRMWRDSGLQVALITGRTSKVVAHRAAELGVTEVHQGTYAKLPVMLDIAARHHLQTEQIAFMGDDLIDVASLRAAGLGLVPADARPQAVEAAGWQSQQPGGNGALREAIEFILAARGQLDAAIERLIAGESASANSGNSGQIG